MALSGWDDDVLALAALVGTMREAVSGSEDASRMLHSDECLQLCRALGLNWAVVVDTVRCGMMEPMVLMDLVTRQTVRISLGVREVRNGVK